MRRALTAFALAALAASAAIAHEGHEHKVMGTVTRIQDAHLEVKAAKDGKTSTVTLNDRTKILRDKDAAKREDIRVGDRVG